MKNVLTYRNETIMLLANVDDGTNRLFINDEEIPSSQWVGTGNYTKTIDGVTISITKIANLSGNIVLKKVTDTSFRLVKKAEALQQSYIGMITTSTTLDTLEKAMNFTLISEGWLRNESTYGDAVTLKVRLHSLVSGHNAKYFDVPNHMSLDTFLTSLLINNTRK